MSSKEWQIRYRHIHKPDLDLIGQEKVWAEAWIDSKFSLRSLFHITLGLLVSAFSLVLSDGLIHFKRV